MTTNLVNLKMDLTIDGGTAVRYKDYVVSAEFVCSPNGEWFEVSLYQPIETEEETDLPFHELRLEKLDGNDHHFDTEGEALMEGFMYIEKL